MKLTGRSVMVGALILVAVAPSACGGKEFTPGVPQTFNIHAAGDTVSLAGGLVTIIVPPGAISEDGNVTATALSVDSVTPSPLLVRNSAYEIRVSPATLQVLDSIKVQVNYASLTLPTGVRGPELRLGKVVSGTWQPVPGGTNDSTASSVAAAVLGFSDFGILGLPVASLVVSPSTISMPVAATQPITASPKDSLGNTLPNRAVFYASSDVTKATVSAAGVVTGIAVGTATITVASETKSAQIPTTVTPGSVSTSQSTVSVSASSVASGGTVTLTLQAKDANGNNLTTGGLTVVFTATGGTSTGTIGATTDHANGTYTATFTASAAGTATTVHATINGTAVTSTLPTITVTPGAVTLTSIAISPSPVLLYADSSKQLTVRGTYSDGSTSSPAVTWSATGGAISATGLYTAPATPGSYKVVATVVGGTLADTAAVTVSALPGGSESGPGPNEPIGFTQVFSNPFNATPAHSPAADAYGFTEFFGTTYLAILDDGTSPASAPNFMRCTFPAGWPGGADYANAFRAGTGFSSGGNMSRLYTRIRYRVSSNWTDNGNVGTKFFFFDQAAGNNHYVNLTGGGEVIPAVSLQSTFGFATPSGPNHPITGTLTKGVWHDIEILLIANTPGTYNGVAKVWVDGVLRINVTDMGYFASGQTPRFNAFYFNPTYGGGSNPVPANQSVDLDHWYTSVAP